MDEKYENVKDIAPLLRRVQLFLEEEDWEKADAYCERILDTVPECAEAYLYKLLVHLQIKQAEDLAQAKFPFDGNINYKRALEFADESLKQTLEAYSDAVNKAFGEEEAEKCRATYAKAMALTESKLTRDLDRAVALFESIPHWEDAAEQAIQCRQRSNDIKSEQERQYESAKQAKLNKYKKFLLIPAAIAPVVLALILVFSLIVPACHYNRGKTLLKEGRTAEAAMAFYKAGNFMNGRKRSFQLWDQVATRNIIANGTFHIATLDRSGKVTVVSGDQWVGAEKTSDWSNIISVAAGSLHTAGLRSDGTVVAVGLDPGCHNVSKWKDIVAISAGNEYTAGLKADGTVVCNRTSIKTRNWKNIVAISAGRDHCVGLKADGTVVTTGDENVSHWKDIIAIAAGNGHTVGLRADGTVVAAGDNSNGQCEVSQWTDIIAIGADGSYTAALKKDGTVLAIGTNYTGRCDVEDWTNITAIYVGGGRIQGIQKGGSILTVGANLKSPLG